VPHKPNSTQSPDGLPLWTITDLAQRLQIKPSTLYAWTEQGKIPCLKIHRLIRFRPEEITRWIESCRPIRLETTLDGLMDTDRGDINALVARAKQEAYTSLHGETRPKPSPKRKEEE
jgi:excisionase family DNA binding protein